MTRLLRPVLVLVWKDVLLEWRSRDMVVSVLVFGLLVVVLFNFALNVTPQRITELAPLEAQGSGKEPDFNFRQSLCLVQDQVSILASVWRIRSTSGDRSRILDGHPAGLYPPLRMLYANPAVDGPGLTSDVGRGR